MGVSMIAADFSLRLHKRGIGGHALKDIIKSCAEAFYAADVNGDHQLDLEEFKTIMPEKYHDGKHEEEIKEIFDMADYDSSGYITRDEYFFWVFTWTSAHAGVSYQLEQTFKAFDETGDGMLNLREFVKALETLGFGDRGHALFAELDADESGTISYTELLNSLKAHHGKYSLGCQRMLTALSFIIVNSSPGTPVAEDEGGISFNHRQKWSASNVHVLRDTIRQRMLAKQRKPYDVFRALLGPASTTRRLSCVQLCQGLRDLMGFDGPDTVVEQAHREMDDDHAGAITFDEFLRFMNNKPQRRQVARSLNLESVRKGSQVPLEYVQWSVPVLQAELKNMLSGTPVSALDLLSAYDKSADGLLSRHEYLIMMKKLIGNDQAWRIGVREVALQVFDKIAGEDQQVDIEELVRWMPHKKKKAPKLTKQPSFGKGIGKQLARQGLLQPGSMHSLPGSMRSLPPAGSMRSLPPVPTTLPPVRQPPKASASMPALRKPAEVGFKAYMDRAAPKVEPLGRPEGGIAGRGLAARWLLPKTSADKIMAVDTGDKLPIGLFDTWYVLPESWQEIARRSPRMKKHTPKPLGAPAPEPPPPPSARMTQDDGDDAKRE